MVLHSRVARASLVILLASGCTCGVPASGGDDAGTEGPPCPIVLPDAITEHSGDITADETWSASSIHMVNQDLRILGATVTVEACALIRMGGSIQAGEGSFSLSPKGGLLDVRGEPGREVRFTRYAEGTRWTRLASEGLGQLKIEHAIFEGGGVPEDTVTMLNGVIFARAADGDTPVVLHLSHVLIDGSESNGVVLVKNVRWSPESEAITIRGTKVPMVVTAETMADVPQGDFTGNGQDLIAVLPGLYGSRPLRGAATLRNRAVPYRVQSMDANVAYVKVGTSNNSGTAQLTIEAGTTLLFQNNTALGVHQGSTLTALGTSEAPITFSWATPGMVWKGLSFADPAGSAIDHALVEGAEGITNSNCSPYLEYALAVGTLPTVAFITNTHFKNIDGHAIHRIWQGEPFDLLANNTFERVTRCKQSYPKDATGACPANPPCP